MTIIAICGFQGSGKDTLADILVNKHCFIKFSFAHATKDVVSSLFGWDRMMLEGNTPEYRDKRNIVDIWWSEKLGIPNFTPRMALQMIGTDLFRKKFFDEIWVSIVERKIIENIDKNIVISDCRFPNEINMVKKYGAKLIHIYRKLPHCFYDYKNDKECDNKYTEILKLHESETSWIKSDFDLEINNNNSIEELQYSIVKIIN